MMQRDACLEVLNRLRDEEVIVVTTMAAAAPWSRISQAAFDFPSVNSAMGHAADFALGLALAQPSRQVWVLNGDGSMLMSLGTLVTLRQTPAPNLVLFVLENGTFEVTGNQPIPGAGRISMAGFAQGAGLPQVHAFDCTRTLSNRLPAILTGVGPIFVSLKVAPEGEPPPNLDRPLRDIAAQLREQLGGTSLSPDPDPGGEKRRPAAGGHG